MRGRLLFPPGPTGGPRCRTPRTTGGDAGGISRDGGDATRTPWRRTPGPSELVSPMPLGGGAAPRAAGVKPVRVPPLIPRPTAAESAPPSPPIRNPPAHPPIHTDPEERLTQFLRPRDLSRGFHVLNCTVRFLAPPCLPPSAHAGEAPRLGATGGPPSVMTVAFPSPSRTTSTNHNLPGIAETRGRGRGPTTPPGCNPCGDAPGAIRRCVG
jgi:hypothetical protein